MYLEETFYDRIKKSMPILCVDVMFIHNKKFLLLKRNNTPALGLWWFPGGRVFKGETISEAAKRKCLEELRINIIPESIISVEETVFTLDNDSVDVHTVNVVIQAKPFENNFIINIDKLHSEFRWFNKIESYFHDAVKNPLMKLDYKLRDE